MSKVPVPPFAFATVLISCAAAAVAVSPHAMAMGDATDARPAASGVPELVATGLIAAAAVGLWIWTARRGRVKPEPDTSAAAPSRERTEEMSEAMLDLEAFNVSVSHDLRSPIGAIVNLTSVLRETNPQLDGDALELLRRIDRSAHRALARMDGLLEFSRLGRKPLALDEVDLHGLASRIASELRLAEPRARTEFVIGEVPTAQGDPVLLEALLRNLLANGAKFSLGREKPRVEFGALADAPGQPTVYFVRDNGIGFDPKYAEKVFGLFERQHHAAEYEGAGAGLAIVARIARRHGGRAWADGGLGEGATFYFTLGRGDG